MARSQEGAGNEKDIRQRILAGILWVAVQEDINETFQDLRQKCRRRPRELPLLGHQSKLLKLRKVFKTIFVQGSICHDERAG